jgi:hypothetical protein
MIGIDFGEVDLDLAVADAADEKLEIGRIVVRRHGDTRFFEDCF